MQIYRQTSPIHGVNQPVIYNTQQPPKGEDTKREMRLTKSLLQLQPWHQTLKTLKSTQLHRLAEATGVKSSGTKGALVERLEGEIPLCECPFLLDSELGGDAMKSGTSEKSAKKSTEMSILSIDMGIRNLAFAHLLVRPHSRTSIPDKAKAQARTRTETKTAEVTLNAWRRLDITNDGIPSTFPGLAEEAKTTQSSTLTSGSESKENAKEKDTFSPPLYAHHAYTLLTTLLQTYKPTHILIERQRFRSAGGSAVQEWTLRVGVFEGMLYTVLYTLARQGFFTHAGTGTGAGAGAGDGNRGITVPVPLAKGVEPSRVVRYWEDRVLSPSASEEEEGKKKRKTSKEGKKAKIDVVGGWLSDAGETGGGDISTSLSVGNDVELQNTVNTYLAKWRGKREKSKEKTLKKDIGKLDDLADCFLQGMTWLEWQIIRGRVAREGVDFLFEDGR